MSLFLLKARVKVYTTLKVMARNQFTLGKNQWAPVFHMDFKCRRDRDYYAGHMYWLMLLLFCSFFVGTILLWVFNAQTSSRDSYNDNLPHEYKVTRLHLGSRYPCECTITRSSSGTTTM